MSSILMICQGYFPALAGAETMARLVGETLQARGHTVTLVCKSSDGAVQRQDTGLVRTFGLPSLDRALLEQVLPATPELVHAVDAVWPDFPRAALALARACGVPFVFTPASIVDVWRDRDAIFEVARAADALFVLTSAERHVLLDHGVAPERVVTIGQGPNLVGRPDAQNFRATYRIEDPMVLFLGRKMASKGYRALLAATPEVWVAHPDVSFVFMGPRWDADCRDVFAAHADPRIVEIDTATEQEKHAALVASTLLCLPSTADVFPLVYVEAWACGKPVIAGPFPGVEEVVRHGQDGLIVEPTPRALAQAINALLDRPEWRVALGAAGRARVREQLNWDVVTDRVERTYSGLLKRTNGTYLA